MSGHGSLVSPIVISDDESDYIPLAPEPAVPARTRLASTDRTPKDASNHAHAHTSAGKPPHVRGGPTPSPGRTKRKRAESANRRPTSPNPHMSSTAGPMSKKHKPSLNLREALGLSTRPMVSTAHAPTSQGEGSYPGARDAIQEHASAPAKASPASGPADRPVIPGANMPPTPTSPSPLSFVPASSSSSSSSQRATAIASSSTSSASSSRTQRDDQAQPPRALHTSRPLATDPPLVSRHKLPVMSSTKPPSYSKPIPSSTTPQPSQPLAPTKKAAPAKDRSADASTTTKAGSSEQSAPVSHEESNPRKARPAVETPAVRSPNGRTQPLPASTSTNRNAHAGPSKSDAPAVSSGSQTHAPPSRQKASSVTIPTPSTRSPSPPRTRTRDPRLPRIPASLLTTALPASASSAKNNIATDPTGAPRRRGSTSLQSSTTHLQPSDDGTDTIRDATGASQNHLELNFGNGLELPFGQLFPFGPVTPAPQQPLDQEVVVQMHMHAALQHPQVQVALAQGFRMALENLHAIGLSDQARALAAGMQFPDPKSMDTDPPEQDQPGIVSPTSSTVNVSASQAAVRPRRTSVDMTDGSAIAGRSSDTPGMMSPAGSSVIILPSQPTIRPRRISADMTDGTAVAGLSGDTLPTSEAHRPSNSTASSNPNASTLLKPANFIDSEPSIAPHAMAPPNVSNSLAEAATPSQLQPPASGSDGAHLAKKSKPVQPIGMHHGSKSTDPNPGTFARTGVKAWDSRGTTLPSATAYQADPSRTLVMEAMPRKLRNSKFVRWWVKHSVAVQPGLCELLPDFPQHKEDVAQTYADHIELNDKGKALVEFPTRELAQRAFDSPRMTKGCSGIRVRWLKARSAPSVKASREWLAEMEVLYGKGRYGKESTGKNARDASSYALTAVDINSATTSQTPAVVSSLRPASPAINGSAAMTPDVSAKYLSALSLTATAPIDPVEASTSGIPREPSSNVSQPRGLATTPSEQRQEIEEGEIDDDCDSSFTLSPRFQDYMPLIRPDGPPRKLTKKEKKAKKRTRRGLRSSGLFYGDGDNELRKTLPNIPAARLAPASAKASSSSDAADITRSVQLESAPIPAEEMAMPPPLSPAHEPQAGLPAQQGGSLQIELNMPMIALTSSSVDSLGELQYPESDAGEANGNIASDSENTFLSAPAGSPTIDGSDSDMDLGSPVVSTIEPVRPVVSTSTSDTPKKSAHITYSPVPQRDERKRVIQPSPRASPSQPTWPPSPRSPYARLSPVLAPAIVAPPSRPSSTPAKAFSTSANTDAPTLVTPRHRIPSEPRAMRDLPKGPSFNERVQLEADLRARVVKRDDAGSRTPPASVAEVRSKPLGEAITPRGDKATADNAFVEAADSLIAEVIQAVVAAEPLSIGPTSASVLTTKAAAKETATAPTSISLAPSATADLASKLRLTTTPLSTGVTYSSLASHPPSSLPPSSSEAVQMPEHGKSTSANTPAALERAKLAARQKKLEQHIAHTKELMEKLSAAKTKEEKSRILALLRDHSRRMDEGSSSSPTGMSKSPTRAQGRSRSATPVPKIIWPTTAWDAGVIVMSDDEDMDKDAAT